MAFETNMNDMKFLFLMLIGIPLIASTNIDCSGKAFHCLNSTHFMICVDLGGGASYTVDDFVIPCPPPTECKASNRFECELPPSTTLAPMTASPITTATFTKQKETTSEDIIVDTISWNTVPEQHLELSSVATQEPAIDTTVIPLQPVTTSDLPEKIVNGTESSIVTNFGVNTLTTVADKGIINIDIESATDIFLVTPGNSTTSIDSEYIVPSDIINENITNSANEKRTETISEVVTTTEIVNVYETGPLNNIDVHLNVTVQQDFVSVATPENVILDSNVPVQSTSGLSLTERSAPTTVSAWLDDNERLSEVISTTETNNIGFEVNVTGSVNNVDVHSNVTEQQDHVSVATPENFILDSNIPVQSLSGFLVTERSAPTTESAWLNDNEKLSEVISTTETVLNETTVTNNLGFEVNETGSVNKFDVHSNVTEQQDHVSVATLENEILDSNVPVQSTPGISITERSAPTKISAWLDDNEKLSEVILTTETVLNETTMTNNIGFQVNETGSVNNVDVHSNVTEQQGHVSVATPENFILDSNIPVQSLSGFSVTERSAPTTESAWLNDKEKLNEIITTIETVINETTVTNNLGFEVNETGSVNKVDVHSNMTEQQDHVSVATPENIILDSNVPVQSTLGLSLTERSAPTTVSAWLDDNEKLSEIISTTETVLNETTMTNNIGFEVNETGFVNDVDVHLNVTEQQDHVSVATPENVILDSNVLVQSTSGLSLTERSAPTTVSAWLDDNEKLSEVISTTETVLNETTVTNNLGFEVNETGSVNKVDVHSNVTEQQDHVSVATPENFILDSNIPVQSLSGFSVTERSAPTTESAWLNDKEKLNEIITTTETVLNETTVTNNLGFEVNETGSVNKVDVHSNVTEHQAHVSVATSENIILDSNVLVQSTLGLSLTERSAPTTVSAWLDDNEKLSEIISTTETVLNETTMTNNIGFEVNETGFVNDVDVHLNVTEQQDHVSVAMPENGIPDLNVPERSAPTTVSEWLNDNEKLSEVILTTETNNIGFEVIVTNSVNNVDVHSNVTEQQDHVSVVTPENVILDSNVPVQSTSGLSLTERSAPTTEFARLNDIQKLIEVITTTETVTNIGLEMNKTGSVSNIDVHPIVTVQQDYVFVNTSENIIPVSNVPVEITSGLSFVERSAKTESVRLNDTNNFTNYDTFVTEHSMVVSTDVQPFSTVVTTVKSNAVGTELVTESFTASASSYYTTESVKSGNESVFLASESILKSAANVNSVAILENRTSTLILTKNITAGSENTTNDFVMTRNQIVNLPTKLNKNISVTLFTEASETSKNVSSETSTYNNIVDVNQYSENNTVSPIEERNQVVTEVPTRLSTVSNYIQNDTTVDIGTTLSTESMRLSVSKLSSSEKENENAIVTANSIYNSSDATVQNTGIKKDSAFNEQSDVVSPILYTTPLPHENEHFFIEFSNSNFNNHNKVKDIGTDLTLSTKSIKSNQEMANGFAVVTESEFTTDAVNSDTQSDIGDKRIPVTSSLLDVLSTVLTGTAETTDDVNLVNNPAYRIENENYVYNKTKKQEKKEIITTENTISPFVPVTIRTFDGLVSSNLETGDENHATIFDDTRSIVDISVNGSNTTTTEINILAIDRILEVTTEKLLPRNLQEKQELVTTNPLIYKLITESSLKVEEKNNTQVNNIVTPTIAYENKTNLLLMNRIEATGSLVNLNQSITTIQNSSIKNIKFDANEKTHYAFNITENKEEKQTLSALRSETSNIMSLLPKDEQGTSDFTTEKNNATNLYQQKNEQVLLFADTYKKQNITWDPSTEDINTKSILKNSVVQKSTFLPSTGQSIDMSKQGLLASISEQTTDIDKIENSKVQKSTVSNIEQSNTTTTQIISPVNTEQDINMNTLLTSVVGQKMATTPSLDHSKIMNTLQNGVVQQITTIPNTEQSNGMKTPLDKDKINQSSPVLSTEQSDIINIIKNGEGELITSTSIINSVNEPSSKAPGTDQSNYMNLLNEHTEHRVNTLFNDGLEQISSDPSTEHSYTINTILNEQSTLAPNTKKSNDINTFQNGDFEQITSASKTEQNNEPEPITWTPSTERNYVITTIQKQQKGGNEQIMSVPRTEQTISIVYTKEDNAQNDVIGQITASSGTEQSHIFNTLLNDYEQTTSTFIVKQNNTMSVVQNSGVDQIMALPSTEKNKLVTGDNTVQYSGVNQIESVLGIEQSNNKIIEQNSIVKEVASDFDMEKNNTLTAKSYVSQNYLESSTITNLITNSESVLNDYSNLQQRAGTNAYESDVTEYIRLSSNSSQDTGSNVVQVSKLEETFSKSATNSHKSTNTPEQTAEIQMNGIRYTDSSNNTKQNGITNIIQNNGVVETGPPNFLEKDSVNVSETKLVRDTVPIVTQAGGGNSEYFSGTTGAELNGPNIIGTHKLLLAALPYESTATVTTEFLKNNEPLVTLSAFTSATTPESILEREESGYNIASNLTFLLEKITPDVVESEPNTVQSREGNSRFVLLENPIEINTQAYEDNSNSGLVSKMIFIEKHVVAATAPTTTATKLSEESQQSSQVNVTVAEKDKISQDGIIQQSIFENLPFAITSTPLEKKHIDNGLTVNSTSSFMEVIQTTHIPLVVEVTTKMTATGTSAASEQESNSTYKPFDCRSRSTGKYADNNDCSKFYICSGTAQLIIGKCPINTVFSEIRKQCTRNLSHCIRNNEFKCMISGRFADYIKPNIYYICVKKEQTFLKYKLQCQEGYLLNTLTVTCYKNLAPVSQSISSDSSQNTTEKISKEIEPVKKEDFECDDEGKFPNPYNCRGYYICKLKNKSDETYYQKYKKCDEDEVFHKEKKKCVDASSYECRYCDSLSLNVYYVRVTRGHHFIKYKLECQEGYYLNATEVRCDKILKATNTKKISKNISQESSKSNSHNHKNKKRFKCQEEGQFVDSNDCRKYYLCQEKNNSEHSDSEQRYRRKHRKCSKHEVYNAEIQACAYSRNMSCLYN